MPAKTKIAKDILQEINDYLEEKFALDAYVDLSTKSNKDLTRLTVSPVEGHEGYMTLLSEGAILYQDGSVRLYITKGTLKNWYDSIDDTFEGYVTTGHVDLNSYPVREGYFRKEHLLLVEDDNGRYDLLVKPVVNLNLSNVKDLIVQDEPFAISSEFSYTLKQIQEEDLAEYAKLVLHNKAKGHEGLDIPITDNISLMGFSFVGNPGNAKSGGYEPAILLRNEEQRVNDTLLDSILAKLNQDAPEANETVTEPVTKTDETVTDTPVETKEVLIETDLVDKATQRIEELEKENEALRTQVAELTKYKQDKQEQEAQDNAKLQKLNALLSKASVTVEQPKDAEEKKSTSIFGRERFGGI